MAGRCNPWKASPQQCLLGKTNETGKLKLGDFFHAGLWSVQSPQMCLCPHLPIGLAFRMILLSAKGCTQDSQFICWSAVILDLTEWQHTNQCVCSSKKKGEICYSEPSLEYLGITSRANLKSIGRLTPSMLSTQVCTRKGTSVHRHAFSEMDEC